MATPAEISYNAAVETLNTKLLSLRGWHEEYNRMKYEGRQGQVIPMINKFIQRSGLTDEEVDKLKVIHITGTKGKGSTSAFTENILRQHGYRTGLFTSPHLVEVRERIRVNGKPVSKETYSNYFWKVYNKLKETEEPGYPTEEGRGMPAYFAFNVVLSLHIFLNEGVDIAIIEVGIGGLTDSTNFLRQPVACAITSLGLEHTEDLGDTIELIAWQKSGIFKLGCPAITAPQSHSALQVILDRAKETLSPLYIVEPLSEEVLKNYGCQLSIAGDKQRHNASLAVKLFHLWQDHLEKSALQSVGPDTTIEDIPHVEYSHLDSATVTGLSTCKWPGRAQTIKKPGVTYYLDGAHTKESMEMCASWFAQAANDEKDQLGGKVVRVLVFFTAPERDPEMLIYPLMNCAFDAAVFSPFVVSTVPSQNRPDLQLKKLEPHIQAANVARNKLSWDRLVASQERQKMNLQLLRSGWPLEVVPTSLVNDSLGSEGESEKSSVTFESDTSDKMSVESNDILDNQSRLADIASSVTSGAMLNYVLEPTSIRNATFLGSEDSFSCSTLNKLTSADVIKSTTCDKPSVIFPCIMEALAWASQGRDNQIQVLDSAAIARPVPNHLSSAAHIQILATGSLNYVGGVLDVLTSHDADVYS